MIPYHTLSLAVILLAISVSACKIVATSTENLDTSSLYTDVYTKLGDGGP